MAIAEEEKDDLAPLPKMHGLKKYFRELFTTSGHVEGKRYQVLDVAPLSKHEIYLAIEESSASSSDSIASSIGDRRVFARLCLAVQSEDGSVTNYRTEDEHEPPALTNCPLRILNLLTPTSNLASLQWRLKCYEKQIAEAQAALFFTRERYEQTHFDSFRDYVRKSAEMMVERRFLILHQALSAEQTTRALLRAQEQKQQKPEIFIR
jgi:hypothetical protein